MVKPNIKMVPRKDTMKYVKRMGRRKEVGAPGWRGKEEGGGGEGGLYKFEQITKKRESNLKV